MCRHSGRQAHEPVHTHTQIHTGTHTHTNKHRNTNTGMQTRTCRQADIQRETHTRRKAGRQAEWQTDRQDCLLISVKTKNKSEHCSCQVYPGTFDWVSILPQGTSPKEVLNQTSSLCSFTYYLCQVQLSRKRLWLSSYPQAPTVIKFLSRGLRNTMFPGTQHHLTNQIQAVQVNMNNADNDLDNTDDL